MTGDAQHEGCVQGDRVVVGSVLDGLLSGVMDREYLPTGPASCIRRRQLLKTCAFQRELRLTLLSFLD